MILNNKHYYWSTIGLKILKIANNLRAKTTEQKKRDIIAVTVGVSSATLENTFRVTIGSVQSST